MKNVLYTIALCLVSHFVLAQTTSKNYVKNTTPQVEVQNEAALNSLVADNKIETITYFDGLGRPIQSIAIQAGGNKQDIITPIVYDGFGRQVREYLPYARANSSLNFDVNLLPDINGNIPILNTQYLNKYPADLDALNPNPFSQKDLEDSPLSRVLEQAAPGSDWALGNGHTIQFDYQTNGIDEVKRFRVDHPNGDTEKTELVYQGYYSANQLFKTVTRDENWISGNDYTTQEFRDKQGQVILKRTFNNNVPHDTYYVYDDFDNLSYVLPPEASDQILMQDPAGRVASLTNYSWINLVNVDRAFADEYNKKLSAYENTDILNADIENAYGGQGGFTVTTLEDKEEVALSINFSAIEPLELRSGELVSLDAYGNHGDTELGRITGPDYSYIFYITNNAIYIEGSGRLNGINEVFNSNTKLAYEQSYLWTNFVDINKDFAAAHESAVLAHAKDTDQDPLTVYLENEYGGRGGLNITVDENDNMVLSFNISSTRSLSLKQGVVVSLDAKRRLGDRYLGTLSAGGYSYNVELKDNNIIVTGEGSGVSFGSTLFPSPPTQDDRITRTEVIEGLCYIYHYDYRNRLIEKKIPGKGWEHIVYDKLDRPVLTQDARLRLSNQWLFTKYDKFGRIAYTGQHQYAPQGSEDNAGRLELQADLNVQTYHHELRESTSRTVGGATLYYSNLSLPNTDLELWIINYYDSYDNLGLGSELLKNNGDMVYDEAIDTNVKSLAVCSQVKVLDPSISSGQASWINSVSYYDNKDMLIYAVSKNDYVNTMDVVTTDYDFTGKVLKTKTDHNINGLNTNTMLVEDDFTYDHFGRLLTQSQTISGGSTGQIVKNNYDEYGQLATKDVGPSTGSGTGLQNVDYSYNIRGWLKEINDVDALGNDLFAFKINYNDSGQSNNPLYNGNIAETFWKTASDNKERGYDYSYDALNRIKAANYHGNYALVAASGELENYSLSNISYDKNGNLYGLKRFGLDAANTTIDVIDDLTYSYASLSNTLMDVGDNASEDGFKDDNELTENDYIYDVNGNMIKDLNKAIVAIDYNHLNLPTKVTFGTGNSLGSDEILYVYDAAGTKLKKLVVDMSESNGINSKSITTTEYTGGFIYEKSGSYSHDGQFWQGAEAGRGLQLFPHPEGYVEPANDGSGNYNYVYQYKDHLGNIRLSYRANNGNLEIIEEHNYYPFGLEHKGYNDEVSANVNSLASNFKFNGQEFNESLNLNVQEMMFRQYNPSIGRFKGIDRFAEWIPSINPYRFGFNNPILWADPTGLIEESVLLDIFNRSSNGTRWYNDNDSGFYTENGGYVGYTSNNRDQNISPDDDWIMLPEIEIDLFDKDDYKRAANKIANSIYSWFTDPENIGFGISALGNTTNAFSAYANYRVASAFKSNSSLWHFQKLTASQRAWRTNVVLGPKGHAGLGIKGNALGKYGSKLLKGSKVLGPVATIGGTIYSGYKIYNGTATTIDYVDTGVGIASIGAAVFLASNPVGWAISAGAGIYFAGRFIYDLFSDDND